MNLGRVKAEEVIIPLDTGVRRPAALRKGGESTESEEEQGELDEGEGPVSQQESRTPVEEEEITRHERNRVEAVIVPMDTGIRRPPGLQSQEEEEFSETEEEVVKDDVPVAQEERRIPVEEEEITRHDRGGVEAVIVPMDTGVRHSSRLHSQEEEEESLVSEEELDKSDVPETLEEMRDPVEEDEIVKHVATKPGEFVVAALDFISLVLFLFFVIRCFFIFRSNVKLTWLALLSLYYIL